MVIGLLAIEIHFPYSRSLKEKRKTLNSLRDRIKTKHNAAFAELEFQDMWQRTIIGIVTLNSRKSVVEQSLRRILAEIEDNLDGEIVACRFSYT